jgi:uncharacterized protein YidB (DUF937 family)
MLEKLISEALRDVMGGAPASNGIPLAQILASLLNNNQGGGLAGLVEQFTRSGLGPQIQSWISTGQNMPVLPDQLAQVFGPARMQQLAQQAGMDPPQLGRQLAEMLPLVVDRITPQGRLPEGGIENALGALGKLMDR